MASDENKVVPIRYCAVYDCTNNYKTHPELSYFSIPPEPDRCMVWLKKIRREDLMPRPWRRVSGYHRVCEQHFEPRFINDNRSRRRLSRRAVPTRLLPHAASYTEPRAGADDPAPAPPPPSPPPPEPAELAVPRRPTRILSRSDLEVFEYVDKRKNKQKSDRDEKLPTFCQPAPPIAAPAQLDAFFTDCDSHLHPLMARFVKTIAQLNHKGDTEGLNDFCVKLLHASPPAYRLLRGALALPPERNVQRLCAPLVLDFDSKVTALLKLRVDRMTEMERHCTISVDFIDLKPHIYYDITSDRIVGLQEINGTQSPKPATRCAVVTARGLCARWAQHVALVAPPPGALSAAWLDAVLRRLLALGLSVRALVTDPAAEIRELLPEKPYFMLDEHKIYRLYDVPRLMKSLLCHFMMYEFHFEKTVAKWNDVLECHALERQKRLSLIPEFTDSHRNVESVRRLRPRRAARALAPPLPAALAALADRRPRPGSARDTVMFILKINNLYDILNMSTKRLSPELRRVLKEDSDRIGFLTYMSSFFKHLKLKRTSGGTVLSKLSERWRVTIESVLALRADLSPAAPLTARLHLDDRVSAPFADKPSYRRVVARFKKQFLNDLLQCPAEHEDFNVSLSRVQIGEGERIVRNEAFEVDEEEQPEVSAGDYRAFRGGGLRAAAACVLAAARRAHGACAAGAAWAARAPDAGLLELLARLDAALAAALAAAAPARARLADLLLDLHVLDCDVPCECFPLDFVKKLFLRLRLYGILRMNRTAFKNCKDNNYKFIVDTLQ